MFNTITKLYLQIHKRFLFLFKPLIIGQYSACAELGRSSESSSHAQRSTAAA